MQSDDSQIWFDNSYKKKAILNSTTIYQSMLETSAENCVFQIF